MKAIIIAAAALATLTASSAFAEPAATAKASAEPATAAKPNPKQRVCLVDSVTGSRLPLKVCKTRMEWANQGVELNQPAN